MAKDGTRPDEEGHARRHRARTSASCKTMCPAAVDSKKNTLVTGRRRRRADPLAVLLPRQAAGKKKTTLVEIRRL